MDKAFIRNFVVFSAMLICCVSVFLYYFISGDRALGKIDKWVDHTNIVISEAEYLSSSIQGAISNQRGFLLSQKKEFLYEYEALSEKAINHTNTLAQLTADNKSQQIRVKNLSDKQETLLKFLNERIALVKENESSADLDDFDTVRALKEDILKINQDILAEEYSILDERIKALQDKKSQYLITLVGGVIIGALLLLIFNLFLLKTQRRKARIEGALKETEDRFALALQGTEDGIFDWDISKNTVFYSERYFAMLGHENRSSYGTPNDFKELIHPEDVDRVWNHVEQYLNNELSEYIIEFRVQHKEGHWLWVQARAKALFDNEGTPYRMIGAHTDITHLKLEQQKLEKEKQKAEEANRAKGEFLAHMSHEIRTPLTAISGIAEILQKNKSSLDDKQKRLIDTLNSSSSSLKDIVNDVLDFSKIESGDIEIEERLFPIEELFAEVTSMMAVKAGQEGINFVFDGSNTTDVKFYGDKARLRQVLVNLIGNSLKFTEASGLVKITTNLEDRDDQQFIRIDVSDTGIGIKPEDFDLIFERFKQADASVSRKYGGTGLGLPISRNLTQLMGGDIFLSSQYGEGSTFSVILPMKVEHNKSDKKNTQVIDKVLKDKIPPSLKDQKKVLLVEDYSGNVVIITYLLDELNITYDVASNGEEAIKLWNENYYDLILMDVQMPVMDGFTATHKIREAESERSLKRIPIIGMTAHALVGDKDKCIEAGMDSYLPKPIVEKDLVCQIYEQIEKSQMSA